MADHPNFTEMRDFWRTGKFDRNLMMVKNHGINYTIASRPSLSLEESKLLLELHPDQSGNKDADDDVTIRMALAENTKHQEILDILTKDSRPAVVAIVKERRLKGEK